MTATVYPNHRADEIDYTVRRAVAAVIAVIVVALLAIAGSALVGAVADIDSRRVAASDVATVSDSAPTLHVAQPGDTLWSIAERYRGDVGKGRYVDALVEINGGASIQIGQAVRLP